ncbi:hypothetical protein [Croceitalea vernalis]|uniref:Lipocalin-like domain-containing protein n=1 Tax=Croceitalea vernalis TaxID=3075599 RepID=A0ABU3BKI1_9FLAO|nr:hypothetical protein [Croceitalea sp. P007]MDT0622677.1 hypothetical protein [Croceitalea sp. P007]
MKIFIVAISLFTFIISNNVKLSKTSFESKDNRSEKKWNNDFVGLWVNEDKNTRGITKCEITFSDNQYAVQMWGSCTPKDCDMGKNNADGIEEGVSKFELLWDSNFAESFVTYELMGGKLKMTNKRSYKDNSGRQGFTIVEYFIKE